MALLALKPTVEPAETVAILVAPAEVLSSS